MSYLHTLVLYQTITPLHVGCGQDVGVVDLPVIRERTTGYPFIPGSGIRGSLRAACERAVADGAGGAEGATDVDRLFGPEAGGDEEVRYAGCVAVHDAKVLLFPVRSDQRVFLWITCPAVLRRFARDLDAFVPGHAWPAPPTACPSDDEVLAPEDLAVPLYLEEFSFSAMAAPAAEERAALATWSARIEAAVGAPGVAARTLLVADSAFHHFVTHATLVVQHNRLTAAKTVEKGALFAVEAVPAEALLYGMVGGTSLRKPDVAPDARWNPARTLGRLRSLCGTKGDAATYLHLGGDEGTGMGVTRLTWEGAGAAR